MHVQRLWGVLFYQLHLYILLNPSKSDIWSEMICNTTDNPRNITNIDN